MSLYIAKPSLPLHMHLIYANSVCEHLFKEDAGFGQGVCLWKKAQTPRSEADLIKLLNKHISWHLVIVQ